MSERSFLERWTDVIKKTADQPRRPTYRDFTGWQIVSIHRDPWSDQVFNTRQAALNYLWSDPEVAALGPVERDQIFRVEQRTFCRVFDYAEHLETT